MTTINYLRKKHKMSIRAFAESLGMSYSFLSAVENGTHAMSAETIKKICDKYGEDYEEMLIAYGIFPDYTKEARLKNPTEINKSLKKVTKKILSD